MCCRSCIIYDLSHIRYHVSGFMSQVLWHNTSVDYKYPHLFVHIRWYPYIFIDIHGYPLVPIGIPWYPLVSIEDVVDAINSCKRERHHAQIRFRRFDSVEHVQTAGFIVKKWFELHLIPPGSVQFSRSQQYARLFNPAWVTSKALLLGSPTSFLGLGHQQGSSAWTINRALSAWATNRALLLGP